MNKRHYCRNLRCGSKLPTPVENKHHAFCCRGCYTSFYRSRCLVCEDKFRRKNDHQRFGSGHKTCQAEYRRFPHVCDARVGGRNVHSAGLESGTRRRPNVSRERRAAKCLDWAWEGDESELRLIDREGKLQARIEASVGSRWRLSFPITAPIMSVPPLSVAKLLAISMALAALPLAETTAAKAERANARGGRIKRQSSSAATFNFHIAETTAGRSGDPGTLPEFLRLTAEQRRTGWERKLTLRADEVRQ